MSAPRYVCLALSATQRAVLGHLREHPAITMPALARLANISERHAVRVCHSLRDWGALEVHATCGGRGRANEFCVTASLDQHGAWVYQNPDINPDISPQNPDINPDISPQNPDINPDTERTKRLEARHDAILAAATARTGVAFDLDRLRQARNFGDAKRERRRPGEERVKRWMEFMRPYLAEEKELWLSGKQSGMNRERAWARAVVDARARGIEPYIPSDIANEVNDLLVAMNQPASLPVSGDQLPDQPGIPDLPKDKNNITLPRAHAHAGGVAPMRAPAREEIAATVNQALQTRFPVAALTPVLLPYASFPFANLIAACQAAKSAAASQRSAFSPKYLQAWLGQHMTVAQSA